MNHAMKNYNDQNEKMQIEKTPSQFSELLFQEKNHESGELNLLITNVSPYSGKNEKQYIDKIDNGEITPPKYEGVMTNEAPITSLIHRLNKAGKCLDKIIYIESAKISKRIPGKEYSHAEYLRKRVDYYTANEEDLCCVAYDKNW